MLRMVVRADAYGRYYTDSNGNWDSCKQDGSVAPDLLQRHFAARQANHVIGLFSTSTQDECLWLCLDFDRHDGDPEEIAGRNWRLALAVYERLVGLRFHPLLLDSNGKGGLHLLVLFSSPVAAQVARSFGRWLVKDWTKHELPGEPEVFPKQDSIEGKYGNFVRLFGRHYKSCFYSRVWDGQEWQAGEAAIDIILSRAGDPVDLVPQEAVSPVPPPQQCAGAMAATLGLGEAPDEFWKRYDGDLRTLDIVSLFQAKGRYVERKGERQYEVECPWASEHTSGSNRASVLLADEEQGTFPTFHCFHAHCAGRKLKDVLAFFGKAAVDEYCAQCFVNDPVQRLQGQQPSERAEDRPILCPNAPLDSARTFYGERFLHAEDRILLHHQGQWLRWDGKRYGEVAEDDLRAELWKWLESCRQWTKETKAEPSKLVPFTPNRSVVTGILDPLKAVANLPGTTESPCWIGGNDHPAPENVIAFDNGLLDVEGFAASGNTALLPHTPLWFSSTSLPHRFEPQAQCPQWLEFLRQVFEGDQERIRALAQWFGYNLTCDNRQQKFALLVGPPRSGKGTTMAVLTHILGTENVANPCLTSLGGRFGLAPLVGKQAAIIGDAHLGRTGDAVAILERLKSIVGGDGQNVDRKGRIELTNVRLGVRFTISVNELPRLPDSSAALRSRMVVLPFNVTFEGKEDVNLLDRLLSEIPGITNWALHGLRDLRASGKLLQPQAGQGVLADFVRLSSPVQAFLQDCCDLGPNKTAPASMLQAAWRTWCADNNHEPGSATAFGIKLRAAVPRLEKSRRRSSDNTLAYHYQGVGLTTETISRLNSQALVA